MRNLPLVLAVLLALAARPAPAAASAKPAPMDAAAMTKAWQAFASPNEHHARLATLAGEWDTRTTFWAGPGAPPQVNEGKASLKMILGGRYLEQRQSGTLLGQPFEGLAYTGYDNSMKRYVTVWLDNFSTAVLVMTGKADAAGKSIRSKGTLAEVLTGKPQRLEDAFTIESADRCRYELWTRDETGRKVKTMEIDYTRAK